MGLGCFPPGCCGVGRPYHPYFLFLGVRRVVVTSVLGAAAAEIWALQTKEEVTFERLSPEESSGRGGVCHAIERKIRIKTAIGA